VAAGVQERPLALNYGEASTANILFQQDIDENVNDDFLVG
jgi:hypothetical protein